MKISSTSSINALAPVNEIVFLDAGIDGFQDLATGVRPGIPVVLVDGRSDGLLQIAQTLEASGPLQAVHIISHGQPGTLWLGAGRVDMQSLAHYQDIWPAFRHALGNSGEILLYGCEVAKGEAGERFVARFAELTGAQVAASESLVGNAEQGGSWDLRHGNGLIAAELALNDAARTGFHGVLTVPTGTFTIGQWSATLSPTVDDPTTSSTIKSDGTAGTGADTGLMAQIITPGSQVAFIGTTPADWTGAGVSVLGNNDGSLIFSGSMNTPNLAYVDRIRLYAANAGDTFKLDGFEFGFKFPSGAAITSTRVSLVGYDSASLELGRLDLGTISGGTLKSVSSTMLGQPDSGSFQNIREFALEFSDSVFAVQLDDLVIATAITADTLAPRVSSIVRQTPSSATTNADSLVYRVTFNEAVSNVNAADFSVTGSTASVTSVSSAGGNAYDVTLSGGNLASLDGTVTLGFAAGQNITDTAGNALAVTTPTGTNNNTYTLDNVAPRVTSIDRHTPSGATTNADSLVYRVTFDGAVSNIDTTDFTVAGTTGTVTNVSPAVGDAYDVTVSGGNLASLNGTVTLGFSVGQNVTDAAGNALNTAPTGTNNNTFTVSNHIPTTTIATAAFSADTGASDTDFIMKTAAQTISGTLSANLVAGETVYVSLDNGGSWTAAAATVGQKSWSLAGRTLVSSNTLQVRITSDDGIDGTVYSQAYTFDTSAPAFQSAAVNGSTLVMTYTDAVTMDASNPPATGDFAVVAGGSTIAVNSLAVNAAAKTVTLTLASAVANGQAVTVAYTDPGNSDDANAIQDAAGNDAATLAATTVANNTAAPVSGGGGWEPAPVTPPAPPSTTTMIDGVSVQKVQVTNSDGTISTKIIVPLVEATRQEQSGNNAVADIPLVTGTGGTNMLTAQVPVGFGLTAQGSASPKTAGSSLADLVREIRAHTDAGSQDQNTLTGGGASFLESLATDGPMLVQTIVPVTASSSTAPEVPLTLTGAPSAPGQAMTALVIDGRNLPGGSEIRLNEIDYAAIIGELSVTGGEGSQNVWGDGSSQYIMLGADDDILHGGGGDDTVGSAGGNDSIFGDEGNDLVFGGAGNDAIDGGTGLDTLRLAGSGRSDYTMRVENGRFTVTHRNGGIDGTDTVANVEKFNFMDTDADMTARGIISRMYDATFDRAPDQQGLEYWLKMSGNGMSLAGIAHQFIISAEAQAFLGRQSDAQFVDGLYQRSLGRAADSSGRDYWIGLLESGKADRAAVMYAFANSEEKIAHEKANGYTLDFNRSDVAILVRMYGTLFDRKADAAGLNHWIAASENGAGLRDIAYLFTQSDEAIAAFSGMNSKQFVDHLYKAGLDRQGSEAELSAWAWQIDNGAIERADALLGVADSAEKIALVGIMSTSFETL
jgi:uncharacterized repeat protein (TIGR02059 family)